MRIYAPIIVLGMAFVVWRHNDPAGPNHLVFPGLSLIPGYEGDIVAQGQLTWQILLGAGSVWLLSRGRDAWRARQAKRSEAEAGEDPS